MFKFFLVSSQVHLEKNALSEAAWILSNYIVIELIKAKMLSVGGLGLLELESEVEIPENIIETIDRLLLTEKIYYCYKIIPLEQFEIFSETLLLNWIEEHKNQIKENETWRVNINKRHSSIKTKDLINQIAMKINNKVDLNNADKIIQIEIIGKFVGMSIIKPFQIIQLSDKITKIEEMKEEDIINSEIDE